MAFAPAPEPLSDLGRYRILSKTAGVRVSPLCLGGMSIGEAWKDSMGSMTKDQTFKLLDEFAKLGGNFIDTANNYQDEESELWIGEWMKARKNRDEVVVATKFSTYYKHKTADIRVNYTGNAAKSLHVSVRDSLAKLQTDYIDLLYVHWWDYTTSVEELMQSLNNLVRAGKVIYLGVSDAPAWVVAKANQYARCHGLAQFSVYQGRWSLGNRDFERDIIPMALSEGMALAPWGAAGSGKWQTKEQLEKRKAEGEGLRKLLDDGSQTEKDVKISSALEKVANEVGASGLVPVALAYVMQKTPYVFPIVGGRKIEHLHSNVEALSIRLSPEQVKYLESTAGDFDLGFPHDILGTDVAITGNTNWLLAMGGSYSFVPQPQPIVNSKPARQG